MKSCVDCIYYHQDDFCWLHDKYVDASDYCDDFDGGAENG